MVGVDSVVWVAVVVKLLARTSDAQQDHPHLETLVWTAVVGWTGQEPRQAPLRRLPVYRMAQGMEANGLKLVMRVRWGLSD
jgi:hypothetical protein